ncbi:MAG: HAD hydrolase-like protein [Lachnospiraceae bacterium]|nr:HAD hydrolase-like protein [Lachnospiraceae bacterium]
MVMQSILFDLDGTIVNSQKGITNCICYVLDYFQMPKPPVEDLLCFIGPPLKDSFMKHFGFDEEKAAFSVGKYRERYNEIGVFECELYPGIQELIEHLHQKGYKLYLASSKPEILCKKILGHFHLENYFDGIFGATMDGKIGTKEQVLEYLFETTGADRSTSILIGDTRFDAAGAREAGISCLGVTYGFGSKEELEQEGVAALCDTAAEVEAYFEKTTAC